MYRNGILGLDCDRMYNPLDIAEIVAVCNSDSAFDTSDSAFTSLPPSKYDISLSVSAVVGEEFHNCIVVV